MGNERRRLLDTPLKGNLAKIYADPASKFASFFFSGGLPVELILVSKHYLRGKIIDIYIFFSKGSAARLDAQNWFPFNWTPKPEFLASFRVQIPRQLRAV